jgi:Putative zinc-finger
MTDHEAFLLLAAKQLSERLSDSEEAELSAHLASCPSCRAMTVAMRRDDILLRGELGVASVSPRVRRRVLDEASGVRRFDRRLILALAATLLLASISIPLLAGGGRSEPPSPVPTSEPTATTQSVALVPPLASESPSPTNSESTSLPPSPGSGPFVTGAYVYGEGVPRRDSIAAHFEEAAVGEWSRTIPATGEGNSYGGPITCLVIDGKKAWMAGRATTATEGAKDRAVFIHVVDGGSDGAGDLAFLVLSTRGQTLQTMEEWCQRKFVPADPYPLTSGDIVVDDGVR